MKSPYRELIRPWADRYLLDPVLVEALIEQESRGRAHAYRYEPAYWMRYCASTPRFANEEPERWAASYGLMQVMPLTAEQFGWSGAPEELFSIPVNLENGCRILRAYIDAAGSVARGLAAYNGGLGGVERENPKYYAASVLRRYATLKATHEA